MSESNSTPAWNEFARLWAECCANVLGQVSGRSLSAVCELDAKREDAPAESCRWFGVQLQQSLAGELALRADQGSAVVMAQLLMADPPNPVAEFTADYADALAELIRQFCGSVAVALKAVQGEEIPVRLDSMQQPGWAAGASSVITLSDSEGLVVRMGIAGAVELLSSLAASKLNKTMFAVEPPPSPVMEPVSPTPQKEAAPAPTLDPSNLPPDLGMLRDIPLNARLSFGDHVMPLADVLGCVPGSVVESDRALEMPVELWVEGLLSARGDIVIVDGSYGMRVRELCYSSPRGSSLSRGTLLAS